MNIPETFSNLRTRAEFDDWPFGRNRCRCVFWIETGRGGERCCRVTENKTRTGWNRAKKTTYAARAVIADGDDGKTYVLSPGGYNNGVRVGYSDMKHAEYLHDRPDLVAAIAAVPSPSPQTAEATQ